MIPRLLADLAVALLRALVRITGCVDDVTERTWEG